MAAGLVGSVIAVMAAAGVQELSCMGVVEDQQVVTELVTQGPNSMMLSSTKSWFG